MEMNMEIVKKNYDTIAQHPAGGSLTQILTNSGFDSPFLQNRVRDGLRVLNIRKYVSV